MRINVDKFLDYSSEKVENNTWKYYHRTMPNMEMHDDSILVKTAESEVVIQELEETIFSILMTFLYVPAWLVENWINSESSSDGMMDEENPIIKIKSWVQIGLVYIEPSPTGEYVRPTALLFTIFQKPMQKYMPIPFNTLTHNISEQQVMFEVMMGKNKINKDLQSVLLNKYSVLFEKEIGEGTNIISEKEFRSVEIYTSEEKLKAIESEIELQIQSGEIVTAEMEDFRKFNIVKKVGSTGNINKDYLTHVPDLIIPSLRNPDGTPNSVAVEIELTSKGLARTEGTLKKYKDNNKFGYLVWFSNSNLITQNLRIAYENIKGTGSCKMLIYEFDIPSPKSLF